MWIKRCLDIGLSAIFLFIFAPILLIAALAVWAESGRPILFRQERVGQRFKHFQILKFRTMRVLSPGPSLTIRGDARITRVGRILRLAKLDEFPQFWNVLRGEMSVVGPRPEIPEFVELYKERYKKILEVRPGITDLASIRFRHEDQILAQSADVLAEYKQRILPLKLDLAEDYLRQQSPLFDLRIIAQTAFVTILGIAPRSH